MTLTLLALVIGCASGNAQQLTLTSFARILAPFAVLTDCLFCWRYQCLSGIGIPNCLYTRLQKSTSISSSPIFLWRASRSLSKSPARLEHLLDDYYTTGEQFSKGLPTVRFCADCLCVAPNYLGDLIRRETGYSVSHFIGRNIIRRAKDMFMSGKSVKETAYALGFDFPSHLSRLFNRLEGRAPSVYLKEAIRNEVKSNI
jgi:AraC-like DNA-binding protein